MKEEYNLDIPIWAIIIIILCGIAPNKANIGFFILFVIWYVVHMVWNYKNCIGTTHVFSIRGASKILNPIIKILTYKI